MPEQNQETFANAVFTLFTEKKDEYNEKWEQYFKDNFDESFEDGERFKDGKSNEKFADVINETCPFFADYSKIKDNRVYEIEIVGETDADGKKPELAYKKIYNEIAKYLDEYFDNKLKDNIDS